MNIAYRRSLLYYDCELIFEAADDAGRKYLAVHNAETPAGCEYAVVLVSPPELAQLKAGQQDLRSLMLTAPSGKRYTTGSYGNSDAFVLAVQPTPVTMCASLPDAGYYVAVNNPEPAEPGNDADADAVERAPYAADYSTATPQETALTPA